MLGCCILGCSVMWDTRLDLHSTQYYSGGIYCEEKKKGRRISSSDLGHSSLWVLRNNKSPCTQQCCTLLTNEIGGERHDRNMCNTAGTRALRRGVCKKLHVSVGNVNSRKNATVGQS